jgi:DNA-directed RNA polymerase subunit RPC12/RpoP
MRLIDADALREEWLEWNPCETIEANTVLYSIDEQPTIDPESLRPVGHWECKAEPFYICSNCKKEVEMFACDDMMDYCPRCGARMEVQDDE